MLFPSLSTQFSQQPNRKFSNLEIQKSEFPNFNN
uniref:Uncharacterized protein n=1 Tax=Rhizophora mucronata TaxID=61149 RepID=A0A2P2PMA5_RHIMU